MAGERKSYDFMCHTHAYVKCLRMFGPMPIVLHVDKRVWLEASHEAFCKNCDATPEEVAQILHVGDGVTNGFDAQGLCVISVPEQWCIYYTSEDARCADLAAEADYRMLLNAR